LDSEIAFLVLLRGYANDPPFVQTLCSTIAADPTFVGVNSPWELLRDAYRGHTLVGPALDAWVDRQHAKYGIGVMRDAAWAATVSVSEDAKQRLLTGLASRDQYVFWPIWGLLEGWGMADPVVRAALLDLASRPPEFCQYFAQHLPAIIDDADVCRRRLLEIAGLPDVVRPDFLIQGFAALGVDHSDEEVVRALVSITVPKRSIFDGTGQLVLHFGKAPAVRDLARAGAARCNAPLDAMAAVYGGDDEMRGLILESATPLPSALRHLMVEHAARRCSSDAFLANILAAYPDETDASVRMMAATGHYSNLRNSGADIADIREAVERLAEEARSTGPQMDEQRLSAMAGMLSLGCLSEASELRESFDAKPVQFPVLDWSLGDGGSAATSMVARCWGDVVSAFGDPPFPRLVRFNEPSPARCWNAIAEHVALSPKAQAAFLQFCEGTEDRLGPEALRALARLRPRSTLLSLHCRRVFAEHGPVGRDQLSPFEETLLRMVAGGILGATYPDAATRELLEHGARQGNPGGIVGLCLHAPQSPLLDCVFQRIKAAVTYPLPAPAVLHLAGACADPPTFEHILCSMIARADDNIWHFWPECVEPVVQRVSRDETLSNLLFARLDADVSASQRASLTQLLMGSNVQVSRLRAWCEHELNRSMVQHNLADVGFDVVARRFRPVAHALLDVLMPYGPEVVT
jgi:hypothetical protein